MSNIELALTIKDYGTLKIELYPEIAPNTVANFLDYVSRGFYNGLIFHRVIKGFMIQGGGSLNNTTPPIKGEFSSNGFKNELKHTKGVLSMARTNDKNSATSQFFIMHHDSPHLDGAYAAFGKVIEGLEIVDKIANVKTNAYDKPLIDVIIENFVITKNEAILPAVKYV
ncbi:peptidylprolyl isomerase [Acholeplasma granularum]|uniref:peptidylprolyl isomerase n=1 Tax=Acholeplasma granularum TaxID=264635 RepID=UPI0004708CC4|nr:peptidylprolyl isomerase [Acholeplasma granularum]